MQTRLGSFDVIFSKHLPKPVMHITVETGIIKFINVPEKDRERVHEFTSTDEWAKYIAEYYKDDEKIVFFPHIDTMTFNREYMNFPFELYLYLLMYFLLYIMFFFILIVDKLI